MDHMHFKKKSVWISLCYLIPEGLGFQDFYLLSHGIAQLKVSKVYSLIRTDPRERKPRLKDVRSLGHRKLTGDGIRSDRVRVKTSKLDWEDGSVKSLLHKAEDLSFNLQKTLKKSQTLQSISVIPALLQGNERQRLENPLKFSGQIVGRVLQTQTPPLTRQKSEDPHPRLSSDFHMDAIAHTHLH